MLLFLTRSTKMHPLTRKMIFLAFMVVATAQLPCDPLTQYPLNGECCKMCHPGTSMSSSLGNCLEPQCPDCGANEYQDGYTKESKCQRQPFCDINKNFINPVYDRKQRSVCLCKEGFHCSTKECITCVPHRPCEAGHGVKHRGNHTHDTVCERCHRGTYSNESSSTSACTKWTECGMGQVIQKHGTGISDTVCEPSRMYVIGIVVAVAVPIIVCLVVLCLGKGNYRRLKDCIESRKGQNREPLRELALPITTPTDVYDEEPTLPEVQCSQESCLRTPVENEDEQIELLLTDNGKIVTQENGKSETLSRQESQTQAFTDCRTAVDEASLVKSL